VAVLSDVEWSSFDIEAGLRADAHGRHDGGMEIGDGDGVFDSDEGAGIGGSSVNEAAFESAAEHQHAGASGEVSVQPVVFHFGNSIDSFCCLVGSGGSRDALDECVATEL